VLIKTDDILSGKYGKNSHFVRFYDNDEVLLDEVAAFVDQALRADGKGIVIASAARCDALRLAPGCVGAGGLAGCRGDAGSLHGRRLAGPPAFRRRGRRPGGRGLRRRRPRACVRRNGGAAVRARQYDAALQLERLWNELAHRMRFLAVLRLSVGACSPRPSWHAFQQVCAEHEHACADARDGLPASGEVDLNLIKLEQKVHTLEAEVARRKEPRTALRRSEREFSDFVENAAEGLHRVGADGTILWANKAELQMLGYRWEEYVGRHIAEFHVDAPVIGDILCRLTGGETLYDQPARLRCKDGSIKHVLIHSNGHFEDGQLRYTRCFTRDATERRERDMALAQRDRMLLNAPVAAALLTGPDFTFRLANRSYCELVGRSELEGKTFLQVFPELRDSEPLHLLEQVYRSKQMAQAEELRIVLHDAAGQPRERFLKFSLEPLAVGEAEEPGVILVAVDVTEHVRSRQQIERAHAERAELLAELTAASQAKDEFLAMLGHELRNPLSPIVTSLQLMRLRGEEGSLREREIIERQVGHLIRLVDDLMDISRVTRGKIDLKFERVEIAQPLGKAVEMASLLLEKRRHRLDVEIEPGLRWEGDPVRLAQVVANLLTNAARYTQPGGHVRLRAGREDASWLRISVADDGVGMAPELRAQVFDLFFQGKRNIDRAEGGLGIGLALVKNIVELHGGRVEARSEGQGRGSEFVVLLPLRTPGAAAEESLAAPQPAPGAARRRIMLVDDNVDGAETLARLLGAHGHEVRVFHEPIAALAAVRDFRPTWPCSTSACRYSTATSWRAACARCWTAIPAAWWR
jgi:PAS domain S-box-containing protein